LVSDIPLETHVFTSLEYGKPVWVQAAKRTWKVEGERISVATLAGPGPQAPCPTDLHSGDFAAREKCCEAGDAEQCRALAKVYEQGKAVGRDVARAAALTAWATAWAPKVQPPCAHCDVCGDVEACGQTCEQHPEDAYACSLAARKYLDAGEKEQALRYAELACKRDVGVGCTMAGTLLMGTMGLPADAARSARLLGRGCELDEPAACGTAGLLYVSGQTFKKDETRGARMLGKSCALGYWPGCATLGQAYENGAGVPHDELRAAEIYAKGCNGSPEHSGSAHACFTLADLYDKGKWLKGDPPKALEFYKKACDLKDAKACRRLEEMKRP
jgi:hypothetical protein